MIVGPTVLMDSIGTGASARWASSKKMSCSIGERSWPPYSFGQPMPSHPSAAICLTASFHTGPPISSAQSSACTLRGEQVLEVLAQLGPQVGLLVGHGEVHARVSQASGWAGEGPRVRRSRSWRGSHCVVVGCSGDDDVSVDDTTTTVADRRPPCPAATPDELAAAVCAAQRVRGRVRVADPEVNELSGLVSLDSGLWANNDSGDTARVFRLDEQGETLAVVNLEGITAIDWEDLSGRGTVGG